MFFRYFVFSLAVLSSQAMASTVFQKLPWNHYPHECSFIAIMPEVQETCSAYLGDGNLGRTSIYGRTAVHSNVKVPALHAYHPSTYRFAAIELDPRLMALLPPDLPLPEVTVKRLFISIEKRDSQALLFRPHRFIDRFTPTIAASPRYNKQARVKVGVFNLDGSQVPFADIAGEGLVETSISVHSGGGDQILSPANMRLSEQPAGGSKAYYSVVSHEDDKTRLAVTLHWLIADEDQQMMWGFLKNASTLKDFKVLLALSQIRNRAETQEVMRYLPSMTLENWRLTNGFPQGNFSYRPETGFEIIFLANAKEQGLSYSLPPQARNQLKEVTFTANIDRVNGVFRIFEDNTILIEKIMPSYHGYQEYKATFLHKARKTYTLSWAKDETERFGVFRLNQLEITLIDQ